MGRDPEVTDSEPEVTDAIMVTNKIDSWTIENDFIDNLGISLESMKE